MGFQVASVIGGASLKAPELLDVEVLSVLRRAVLRREITEQRSILAIEDLVAWSIDISPKPLVCRHGRTGTTYAYTMRSTSQQHEFLGKSVTTATTRAGHICGYGNLS